MKRLLRSAAVPVDAQPQNRWEWPIDATTYDRFKKLRKLETTQLAYVAGRQRPYGHFPKPTEDALRRLLAPWLDVMAVSRSTGTTTGWRPHRGSPGDAQAAAYVLGMGAFRLAGDPLPIDQ